MGIERLDKALEVLSHSLEKEDHRKDLGIDLRIFLHLLKEERGIRTFHRRWVRKLSILDLVLGKVDRN